MPPGGTRVTGEFHAVVITNDSVLSPGRTWRGVLANSSYDIVRRRAADYADGSRQPDADRMSRSSTCACRGRAATDTKVPEAAKAIRDTHPDVGVLVLSQVVEPRACVRPLPRPGEGYRLLLKDRVLEIDGPSLVGAAGVERGGGQ